MKTTKQEIENYIEESIDDYYPNSSEGMLFANEIEDVVSAISEDLNFKKEKVLKIINEMLNDDELQEDSIEYENPENEQQTIYVNYFYLTKNKKEIDKEQGKNQRMTDGLDIIKSISEYQTNVDDEIEALKELGFDFVEDDIDYAEGRREIIANWNI